MRDRSAAIMKHMASDTCNKIIQSLTEGLDHPDDTCKKLGVVRQTVDWHLVRLSALGIVERVPISSLSGRPKIVYHLSENGMEMMRTIDDAVQSHYLKIKMRYEEEIKKLDHELATGSISEAVYIGKIDKIEKEIKILQGAGTAP